MPVHGTESPQTDAEYEREDIDIAEYEDGNRSNERPGSYAAAASSSASVSDEFAHERDGHRQHAKAAMDKLKQLDTATDWKRVLKAHKSGVDVYIKKDVVTDAHGKEKKVPIYRGEKVIEGFTPEEVFHIAGQRRHWDDWYDTGNLVADLDESTSLTYMNLKVQPAAARPRDVSLVERVECGEDGIVYFASTSVESSRIPHVHGRVRANMLLHGFVLKPVSQQGQPATSCGYYVQADAEGFLPAAISSWVIQRRPTNIANIEACLRERGSMATSSTRIANGRNADNSKMPEAKVNGHTVAAERAAPTTAVAAASTEGTAAALPQGAVFLDSHASSKEVEAADTLLMELLREKTWSQARDGQGHTIYFKREQDGTSTIRSNTSISGVTTEQVIGTLLSSSARRSWDDSFASQKLQENINGFDQCILRDSLKGIYPHLKQQDYNVVRAVKRQDAKSDNGDIRLLQRTSKRDKASGHVDLYGWHVAHNGNDDVEVTHVCKSSLSPDTQVPDFVRNILMTTTGGRAPKLRTCVEKYGHAPYFLRWPAGGAQLDGDHDGDMGSGRWSWKISAAEKSSNGATIAWLQYSAKMYPQGIALSTSEKTSLDPRMVEGEDCTLQLDFANVPKDGLTLSAVRSNGDSASHITVDGRPVSEIVAAARQAGAAPRRVAAVKPVEPAKRDVTPAPEAKPAQSQADETKRNTLVALLPDSQTLQSAQRAVKTEAADLVSVHRPPKLDDGRRALPDDAMLILSKDLYFTRAQMAVISVLLAVVYSFARFT